jgi:hypothetical protein
MPRVLGSLGGKAIIKQLREIVAESGAVPLEPVGKNIVRPNAGLTSCCWKRRSPCADSDPCRPGGGGYHAG